MEIADIDLVLLHLVVSARFGQDRATDTLVSRGLPFVGVSDPKLMAVYQIMKNTSRPKEMVSRIEHVYIDRAIHALCYHEGLLVILVSIQR